MIFKNLRKDFFDVILMPFRGENVRVLRNKTSLEWAFFKEEKDQLFPLKKSVLKELNKIYHPKMIYSLAQIGQEAKEKNRGKSFKSIVVADYSIGEETFPVLFKIYGSKKNRQSLENLNLSELLNDCVKLLKKYGISEEEQRNIMSKLKGTTFSFDSKTAIIGAAGVVKLPEKKIKICPFALNGPNELKLVVAHEILHVLSFAGKADCGIRAGKFEAINEAMTDFLAHEVVNKDAKLSDAGYFYEMVVLKALFDGNLPNEIVKAFFENNPEKFFEYSKQKLSTTDDEFKEFLSVMDSNMHMHERAQFGLLKAEMAHKKKINIFYDLREKLGPNNQILRKTRLMLDDWAKRLTPEAIRQAKDLARRRGKPSDFYLGNSQEASKFLSKHKKIKSITNRLLFGAMVGAVACLGVAVAGVVLSGPPIVFAGMALALGMYGAAAGSWVYNNFYGKKVENLISLKEVQENQENFVLDAFKQGFTAQEIVESYTPEELTEDVKKQILIANAEHNGVKADFRKREKELFELLERKTMQAEQEESAALEIKNQFKTREDFGKIKQALELAGLQGGKTSQAPTMSNEQQ